MAKIKPILQQGDIEKSSIIHKMKKWRLAFKNMII